MGFSVSFQQEATKWVVKNILKNHTQIFEYLLKLSRIPASLERTTPHNPGPDHHTVCHEVCYPRRRLRRCECRRAGKTTQNISTTTAASLESAGA